MRNDGIFKLEFMSKGHKKQNSQKRGWFGKIALPKLFLVIFLVVVIFIGIIVGYFYLANQINPNLKKFYKLIPLPIVQIENNKFITSKQLFQDVEAVEKFYESKDYTQSGQRVDFSTSDGKIRLRIKEKDILDKLIEDDIVRAVAKSKGINITSTEVDKAVEKSLLKAGSDYEKLALNLESSYGWTIDEFKNKIVKNQLYLQELFDWYKSNLKNSVDYKTAQKAKSKISVNGDNFDEVAKEFSSNNIINNNEEIPWIQKKYIIPEVAKVLSSMKEGEISNVIISSLGMHIIMLEKKRETKNEQGETVEEFQLKQIFIRGKSFIDWLQEQKKQMKVKILLKEYRWNKNSGELDFADVSFSKTAQKIKIKSQGDPSL